MAELPALMRQLRSPRRTEQLKALCALDHRCVIGTTQENKYLVGKLVEAGAVPLVLSMVCSGSRALQVPAVGVLPSLAAYSQAACEACGGAIPALAAMLLPESEQASHNAAMALGNLLDRPARCAALLAAGGHTALLQLAAGTSGAVREGACYGLTPVAADASGRAALLRAAPFPALVNVLASGGCSDGNAAAAVKAAGALELLCMDDSLRSRVAAAQAATAAGAPAALVQLLQCNADDGVLEAASATIGGLAACGDPGVCGALDAAGCMPALAAHLCGDSCSGVALAAVVFAVANFADTSLARSAAMAAMPGVLPRLVQLLGGGASEEAQLHAAGALTGMLHAGDAQLAAAAVAAGAAPALAAALRAATRRSCLQFDTANLAYNLAYEGQAAALLAARVEPLLHPLVRSPEPEVSQAAADTLAVLADPDSLPAAQGKAAAAPATAAEPAGKLLQQQQQQQRPRRTCDGPGCSATRGLRLCGGCAQTRYCSQACSHAHWREHRAECRRLQAKQAAAAGSSAEGTAQ